MKRLLRIGFNSFILSLIPIISWFLLGLTLDSNLLNVFSITYPIQFISALLLSIFGTGANVSQYKDKRNNSVLSSMVMGLVLSIVCSALCIIFANQYLSFMNVEVEIYRTFTIYAFVSIFIRLIFSLVLEKMYFEEKEKQATVHTIIFNVLNLVVLVGLSLITKNQKLISIITLSVIGLYALILFFSQFTKFKFSFQILPNIKYESENIFIYILLFITYFIGYSNSFEFGEEYIVAINFVTLITDSQWDTCEAMSTVAKLDIVNKKYDFKKQTKQSYLFVLMLIFTSVVSFFALFSLYDVNLKLGIYYLIFEIVAFLLSPIAYYFEPVSQIEYSPVKNTAFTLISEILRTVFSIFLPIAYCTQVGMIVECVFMLIVMIIIKKKNFKVNSEGYLVNKNAV